MAQVVLLRIDDRLLHGQIGKFWLKEVGADLIVVANDNISADKNEQKLMDLTCPIGTKAYYLSVDDAGSNLESLEEDKDTLVIVESPKDALSLIKAGLKIDSINLGNMRNTGNKDKVNETVYVDDEDRKYFEEILATHKNLDIRSNPTDDLTDIDRLFS